MSYPLVVVVVIVVAAAAVVVFVATFSLTVQSSEVII